MIAFALDVVPPTKTAQQKRLKNVGGKPRFFHDKEQKTETEMLTALLMPHVPPQPISGATRLSIEVVWPYRQSDVNTRATRDREDLIPHTAKPDLDNWCKAFQDLLVALRFIEADQQVSTLVLRKHRGRDPGIHVKIDADERS